jgi:hypothetical protein
MSKTWGFNVMAAQCLNRWRHLVNKYKMVRDHNTQTGAEHITMPLYEAIAAILGDKPSVHPPCVLGSMQKDVALGEGKPISIRDKIDVDHELVPLDDDNEAVKSLVAATKLKAARMKQAKPKSVSPTQQAVEELKNLSTQLNLLDNSGKDSNESDEPLLQFLREQQEELKQERKLARESDTVFRNEILGMMGSLIGALKNDK